MSQQPSIPGEEMGTTWLLLPFETFMMTQLKGIELRTQKCSYGLRRLWTKEEEGRLFEVSRVNSFLDVG